ncbi:MAG: sigma-54 dependent transcriptional regulator [Planctomycetes bacterium]|nr:sigma-54 dependent transcriptional regulator [Planctomycetota bacterium]
MEHFQGILLDVWREACRHIEIEQSAEIIARILTHRMPIDQLWVWAFEFDHGLAVPSAIGLKTDASAGMPPPKPLRKTERQILQDWLSSQATLCYRKGDGVPEVMRILAVHDLDNSWMAGPLSSEHGLAGALLLRAHPPAQFEAQHVKMADSLIEPFSVALENDRRLHELNALREAAEADKRSALTRLGRDELVDTIIGGDSGLLPVMQRVALVAKSDIAVLILGETGSGKEVIARAIHEQSPHAKGPFIRVNCGAIPPELIDSELFGHEKGAFTGATASRKGWFERADGGTLLLDEIGDLPPPAQVRLLRVLQEGAFERVGGERPVRVNVRIVAATHRDLPAMVQDGRFREDLWYRVAGFPVVLPPLRERKQDIPALAAHFAQRAARRFGIRAQTPTRQDLQMLASYDWPGNIRELSAVMDRAALLGDGMQLEVAKALGGAQAIDRGSPGISIAPANRSSGTSTLNEAMRTHIEAVLRLTRGRVEGEHGAAKLLDINPHTLRARMRKLKIEWEKFRAPN